MATAIHPRFEKAIVVKIFPAINFSSIRNGLVRKLFLISENEEEERLNQSQSPLNTSRQENFFGDSLPQAIEPEDTSDEALIDAFLIDPNHTFTIFDDPKYKKLRELFIMLNNKIPSSASVERFFSLAKYF